MKRFSFLFTFFICSTLSIAQKKDESLKIIWPEEYKWKIGSHQEDKTTDFMEIIPGKEDINKWTMIGTMMSMKNVTSATSDMIVDMYTKSSKKESSKAKLTVLEKNDTAKNMWVIFKIETPNFPNDPKPESQLYYAIQGKSNLFINFVGIKEKTLSSDFVSKWTKIFQNSELVYE